MKRRAIFLDRDGTLSEEVGYVNHVSRYRLLPHALEAIRAINQAGWLAIVVTNQAGIARGYFGEAVLHQVHDLLRQWTGEAGVRLDAIYYCPHHPREGEPPWRADCDCRKPRPGMLLRAAREHDIDLRRSWMVGDSVIDIEAGAAAGMPGVLVLTGYGRGLVEHQKERFRTAPIHTAEHVLDAVRFILKTEETR